MAEKAPRAESKGLLPRLYGVAAKIGEIIFGHA